MVEKLALEHRCMLIKLPGHCGMPDPKDFSKPTVDTELAIIEEVIDTQTDEPVHLVGHSFGGVIALAQALKGNLALSQISLFEPVNVSILDKVQDKTMNEQLHQFLSHYRQCVSRDIPYSCGQVIDFWAGSGAFDLLPSGIKNSMNALVANNIRHWDIEASLDIKLNDLQKLNIPTRLVSGTQSNPLATAICEHLSSIIENSKNYRIEGASHFLVTSHAAECIEALTDPFTDE